MQQVYTAKEKQLVVDMVTGFQRVHDNQKRLELVWWYSLATGIKDDDKVKRIMEDIGAIKMEAIR